MFFNRSPSSIELTEIQSRWKARRDAAFAARESNGFRHASSFTNRQLMHGWDKSHAVRELWQNLRDGVKEAYSNGKGDVITTPRFEIARITLSVGGEDAAYVDWSAPGSLVLWQRYAVLKTQHLLLSSDKKDVRNEHIGYAGCHGEGFKVAINFLLGRGFRVTYEMDRQRWTFEHVALPGTGVSKMEVSVHHTEISRDHMIITIAGAGAGTLFDPNVDWDLFCAKTLVLADPTALSDRSLGVHSQKLVLTSAIKMAGRTYNRGLFVAMSDELEKLGLCVNLDFDMQRDRHTLPSNLPMKVGDVVQQAMSLRGLEPPAGLEPRVVDAMCKGLFSRFSPAKQAAEWLAPALREHLRSFYANIHSVPSRDVVFVLGDDFNATLLMDVGLTPILNAGSLTDAKDFDTLILGRVRNMPIYTPTDPRELERLGWLNKFATAMFTVADIPPSFLIVKSFPSATTRFCMIDTAPSRGREIYFSSHCVVDAGGWRSSAPLIMCEVMRYRHSAYHMPMADALSQFMAHPDTFEPANFHRPSSSSSGGGSSSSSSRSCAGDSSSGGSGATAAAAGAGSSGSRAGSGVRAPQLAGPSSLRFAAQNSTSISIPPFSGVVPHSFAGHDERYVDAAVTCRVPHINHLEPQTFRLAASPGSSSEEVTIHVDLSLDQGVLAQNFNTVLSKMLPNIRQLINSVADRLQLRGLASAVVFVVCEGVWGFNTGGGIYLNVWPLANVDLTSDASQHAAYESLIHTLLHEVTHWQHQNHDVGFASTFGKLVWACRPIFR